MDNKTLVGQQTKMTNEKMKGRFQINVNRKLTLGTQINKLANDPVSYYMHKNRNFIHKLKVAPQVNELDDKDYVSKLQDRFKERELELQRKMWYAE